MFRRTRVENCGDCKMHHSEDDPWKLVIEKDFCENFPSLNSVYKREMFGTPISLEMVVGKEFSERGWIKINTCSIAFMREYQNKSFEELRHEDYQCNRKGVQLFEDRNYLRCLAQDKWKSIQVNTSKSYDNLSTCSKRSANTSRNVTKDDIMINTKYGLGKMKERSFLTNVDNFSPIVLMDNHFSNKFHEEPTKGLSCVTCSKSDVSLRSNYKESESYIEIMERYFENFDSDETLPCEFFSINPHNYLMPCGNITLAYNYTEPQPMMRTFTEDLLELLQTYPYGYYYPLFTKFESNFAEDTLYGNLFEAHQLNEQRDQFWLTKQEKYTSDNRISKWYVWGNCYPYCVVRKEIRWMKRCGRRKLYPVKQTTTKNYLLGRNITL